MASGGGEWRPAVSLLVVNVALGVMNILVKKSLGEGLNSLVLITLLQLTATLFMAPIAYFKERKSRPNLTWCLCVEFFSSALLGASLTQYLFFLGLQYTSATFACAFLNISPAPCSPPLLLLPPATAVGQFFRGLPPIFIL